MDAALELPLPMATPWVPLPALPPPQVSHNTALRYGLEPPVAYAAAFADDIAPTEAKRKVATDRIAHPRRRAELMEGNDFSWVAIRADSRPTLGLLFALINSPEVFSVAHRRCQVIEIYKLNHLFSMQNRINRQLYIV